MTLKNIIIIKSHCSFKGGLCNVGLKTNFPPNSNDDLTLHCPGNTIDIIFISDLKYLLVHTDISYCGNKANLLYESLSLILNCFQVFPEKSSYLSSRNAMHGFHLHLVDLTKMFLHKTKQRNQSM